jgi:hypothetical protein
MLVEPLLHMLGRQLLQRMAADTRHDVEADRLFIGEERSRPKAGTRDVLQPVIEELRDGLPFARHGKALLDISEDPRQLPGDIRSRLAINRLSPTFPVRMAEIDSRPPTSIRKLTDRAFSATAPSFAHLTPSLLRSLTSISDSFAAFSFESRQDARMPQRSQYRFLPAAGRRFGRYG